MTMKGSMTLLLPHCTIHVWCRRLSLAITSSILDSKSHCVYKKASKEEPEKKKKVYSLPGQKHDPPDERDPLRIFYESLYEQNSKSEMAEVWMMEHGLLEPVAAKKAFERKKKNQVSQKLGSPVKQSRDVSVNCEKKLSTNTTAKSEKKSSTVKSEKKSSTVNGDSKSSKAKRIRDSDSDEDDDFILKPKKKSKSSA